MKKILTKKNIKWFVIVLIIIILYFVFAIIFNGGKKESSNAYLYIGNYLIWNYQDGKYVQVTSSPSGKQKFDYVIYDAS